MVQDKLSSGLWMVLTLGFLGACGGNVDVASGGNGGEGGTGAEGGGTTTTTNNTGAGNTGGNTGGTGGNTGGTGGNTGGTGGNTGGTGGNTGGTGGGTGGTGGSVACEALGEVDCVGTFPNCVPVYDDKCCSTCYPGACADCTNLYFHHCAPWQELCGGGPTQDCGFAPEWACNGKEPDCQSAVSGVDPCSGETGCIPAYCSETADCPFAYQCHPVKPNMCIAICAAAPPDCPPGTVGETDGACWTGLCIPQDLCSFAQ